MIWGASDTFVASQVWVCGHGFVSKEGYPPTNYGGLPFGFPCKTTATRALSNTSMTYGFQVRHMVFGSSMFPRNPRTCGAHFNEKGSPV